MDRVNKQYKIALESLKEMKKFSVNKLMELDVLIKFKTS